MVKTLTCYGCKEKFPREELVGYAGFNAQIPHNYCPNCLKEKQSREKFSIEVCKIFGMKKPSAQIWAERKRLIDAGYTDATIIECLDYVYNVKKIKKIKETLYFVNANTVEELKKYKQQQEYKNQQMINAIKTKMIEHVVTVKENTSTVKKSWDPDYWLNID